MLHHASLLARLAFIGISVVAALSGVPDARAQADNVCRAPDLSGISEDALFDTGAESADQSIVLEAGSIEAILGEKPRASMSGGVLLRRGLRLAGADSAIYDPETYAVTLTGDVRYRDPASEIRSDTAEFSYSTGRIIFRGAEFQLGQGGARGAAGAIDISQEGTISLGQVEYTTCPPGSNDWLLKADDIRLDTNSGFGTAKNVALRFQGIPFLYAPRLSFPLGDARKTGFLAPEIGSAQRTGNEIRAPYYWNIAPNYDATITPRLLTDRGLQLGTEFRYLTENNEGAVLVEYLPDDDEFNDTRSFVEYRHRTLFENGSRGIVDFSDASDGRYFEDLRGTLSAATITHLNRSAVFDYYGDFWSFFGRVQDYQVIDEAIVPDDEPYRRVPQLQLSATSPYQPFGIEAGFDGEIVNFDRDTGVTGWRLDLQPRLSWGVERAGWFVKPEVILEHTQYELDNVQPDQPTDPSRTLPISSLDLGFNLERRVGDGSNWIQTLEPRLLYVHVPFRNQSDLPVFDTILPDNNLVQLFRKNRFLGIDRITDTDQLSFGVTTRLLNAANGDEIVFATIGQTRYLSEQGVTLPNNAFATTSSSDYVAEIRFLLFENFNFDIGHQWGDGDRGTTKSEARLQYRPSDNKVLNLAYRFRQDSLEQGDISWSWPVTERWNFVGRYNYSLRDDEVLEQFFGLEYESCCWGLRLVSRRYVSTREGTQDSSVGLQLVLKGMASVGSSADRILERGILGYSRTLE
ncbi:MAG: LPS assembly protein LptD [Pseudomonadota bacterium]